MQKTHNPQAMSSTAATTKINTEPTSPPKHESWIDPTILITAIVALLFTSLGSFIGKTTQSWATAQVQNQQISYLQATIEKLENGFKEITTELREDFASTMVGIEAIKAQIAKVEVEIRAALAASNAAQLEFKERLHQFEGRLNNLESLIKTDRLD